MKSVLTRLVKVSVLVLKSKPMFEVYSTGSFTLGRRSFIPTAIVITQK